MSRAIILLSAPLLAYLPILWGGYLWDDRDNLIDNPIIQAPDGLARLWLQKEGTDFLPMSWSVFWVEYRLWGNHAAGYHAVNLLLHVASVYLLWRVLEELRLSGAWWAAMAWALHPVNVATVGWISEIKNTLSAVFYLSSTLCFLRQRHGASLALFALGLMSKSSGVMLPVILLCVTKLPWKDRWRLLPFFLLSACSAFGTMWSQEHDAVWVTRPEGLPSRVLASAWMPWFYWWKDLVPLSLCMVYPRWEVSATIGWHYLPLLALVALLAAAWRFYPPLWYGAGFFLVMAFPVLGFFGSNYHHYSLVADHWQYLPMMGMVALAGYAVMRHHHVVSSLALMLLATLTCQRAFVFQSEQRMWEDNLRKNPQAWVAHGNLGVLALQRNQLDEAEKEFSLSLQMHPATFECLTNMGTVKLLRGQLQQSVDFYRRALELQPKTPGAYVNLARALLKCNDVEGTVEAYTQAVHLQPKNAENWNNLGAALTRWHHTDEAITCYQTALTVRPDYLIARCNLAASLLGSGHASEALPHLDAALRLAEAVGNQEVAANVRRQLAALGVQRP